jgi:hypothetical protein
LFSSQPGFDILTIIKGNQIGKVYQRDDNMAEAIKPIKIIVISDIDTVNLVRDAIGDSHEVIHISDPMNAVDAVRKERPSIIILGYIEPQGTTSQLYFKLKDGLITRNIPIIIVEMDSQDPSKRVLNAAKSQQIAADQHIILSNTGRNILRETILKRLKENTNVFKAAILNPEIFCILFQAF